MQYSYPTRLHWRDPIVDLLVTPDGRCRVLDEDELPPDLDPALRMRIAAARDAVLAGHPALLAEVERRSAALLGAWCVCPPRRAGSRCVVGSQCRGSAHAPGDPVRPC